MTPGELRRMMDGCGALLDGHFILSSGLHSPQYLQCALLLCVPETAEKLGRALAALSPRKPDLILSPALGGVIVGQEVARALGVRHCFLERENGRMTLRRGFKIKPQETFAVVEDVITTGGSTEEVLQAARESGARPVAALSIVDRSSGRHKISVPLKSLIALDIPAFEPGDCPLCESGAPAVKPGSRK